MGHTDLIELASKARAFACAPYSKFAVRGYSRHEVRQDLMKVLAATVGRGVQELEIAELSPLPGQGVLERIRHV